MTSGFGTRLGLLALMGTLLFGLQAEGDVLGLVSEDYGGSLSNGCDYDWWYGCSVTSAGMLMGYYDRNGYGGLLYPDLVPGGVAEATAWSAWPDGQLARTAMASTGHQTDFYSAGTYGTNTGGGPGHGYGDSGDDLAGPHHSFDCLADFMGTSQDSYDGVNLNNVNGATSFWYSADGSRLTYTAIEAAGKQHYHDSGMYGMYEYVDYSGYDVSQLYNQYTDNYKTAGFTFDEYKAEIDAGRPVLIHVEGHTMFGYGYDDSGGQGLVTLNDTWTSGPHSMTWGGDYSGLGMRGVTVLELTGGVPEPGTLVGLVSMIPVGLAFYWRRRRKP